ncbi:MAG: hypothetical protein AAF252_11665 [Pseudomonadota bacterium]
MPQPTIDMKIYCLIWDNDGGTTLEHFFSEEDRAQRIKSEIVVDWNAITASMPMPDDWMDAWAVVSDKVSYWLVTEEIDLLDGIPSDMAWKICKAKSGSFGNLYDPAEIATITDGWSDEGDESETSHNFDQEDVEDMLALTAWCETEGPDFEDQISKLVCENLPTRGEAFAALERKHAAERARAEA